MQEQEQRVPAALDMGYYTALKYMRFYKKLPFVLACITWGLFFLWGIIDACAFRSGTYYTYYGVMQLGSGFFSWLIWFAIGAVVSVAVYFGGRFHSAHLLLQIHFLQIAANDEDVVLDGYYEYDEEYEEGEYEDEYYDGEEYDDDAYEEAEEVYEEEEGDESYDDDAYEEAEEKPVADDEGEDEYDDDDDGSAEAYEEEAEYSAEESVESIKAEIYADSSDTEAPAEETEEDAE